MTWISESSGCDFGVWLFLPLYLFLLGETLEVACAWETLVGKRERSKYQELAADMAMKEEKRQKVIVVPVVVGTMGVVESLRSHLKKSNLLKTQEIDRLAAEIQREALCGTIRVVKRHFAVE